MYCIRLLLIFFVSLLSLSVKAQNVDVELWITSEGKPLSNAHIRVSDDRGISTSDKNGCVRLNARPKGKFEISVSALGFVTKKEMLELTDSVPNVYYIELRPESKELKEVVISGTLKEVSKTESPVLVELYTSSYFKKNPSANLFEGLQNVNGVRPQVNCNVCNTGDIHINGLEGPYTMVMIDGMPIVSALSTVYGMSGIPASLIERVEVVKGPASSLYGSEAIGGLINVITKKPSKAPKFSVDFFTTSWAEVNTDIGLKFTVKPKLDVLSGINYFNYQVPIDKNKDNFTDITLQHRVSLFQKWSLARSFNRRLTLSARYVYEDRWGGEMNWTRANRGGQDVYGESIYTSRSEIVGFYDLPIKENIGFSFSLNQHDQNSAYGKVLYRAKQRIAFGQMLWNKLLGNHDLMAGLAIRYTYYTDNTPAMGGSGLSSELGTRPQRTILPGLFIQDEISLAKRSHLLFGFRVDHHNVHGIIYTPRLAYKVKIDEQFVVRFNAGTGFRVVNLFSEDHAALTGARTIVVSQTLNPEQSYNANLNVAKSFYLQHGYNFNFDGGLFYTYFSNRILADYDSNPNEIRYQNLNGYATSKGITLNAELNTSKGIKARLGATWMENLVPLQGKMSQQLLTERFTGVWQVSYPISKLKTEIDYTGNVYSPMRLPLLGPLDPRPAYSPWWSLQNIQFNFKGIQSIELYGGIKNLLNYTPPAHSIARPFDPFDKQVEYDANGQVIATPNNPNALTFDPTYVFAPNQGRRFFAGFRYTLL